MAYTAHVFNQFINQVGTKTVNLSTDGLRVILLTSATTGLAGVQDTAATMTAVKAAAGFTELATSVGSSNYTQNANSHLSGQALTSPTWNVKATTVAAGSNTVNTSTFAGSGTLNVATTAPATGPAFPATGSIEVATGTSNAIIAYTGITGTTFTGCTTSSGGGVLSTGGAVTSADHVYTLTTATNPAWTTAGAAFNPAYAVFFDDIGATDATNFPICWWDFGGAQLGTGGTYTLTIAATGILTVTGS